MLDSEPSSSGKSKRFVPYNAPLPRIEYIPMTALSTLVGSSKASFASTDVCGSTSRSQDVTNMPLTIRKIIDIFLMLISFKG
jgi:hypothetical protein